MSDERRGLDQAEAARNDIIEVSVRRLVSAIVIVGLLVALGLYSQDTAAPNYQIVAGENGRIYRLNTDSGSIVACEEDTCALIQRGSSDLVDELPARAAPALPAPAKAPDNAAAPAPAAPAAPAAEPAKR